MIRIFLRNNHTKIYKLEYLIFNKKMHIMIIYIYIYSNYIYMTSERTFLNSKCVQDISAV